SSQLAAGSSQLAGVSAVLPESRELRAASSSRATIPGSCTVPGSHLMRKRRAMGERLGGVFKRPRVYAALALPIAIPLFLAAVRAQPEYGLVMNGSTNA